MRFTKYSRLSYAFNLRLKLTPVKNNFQDFCIKRIKTLSAAFLVAGRLPRPAAPENAAQAPAGANPGHSRRIPGRRPPQKSFRKKFSYHFARYPHCDADANGVGGGDISAPAPPISLSPAFKSSRPNYGLSHRTVIMPFFCPKRR